MGMVCHCKDDEEAERLEVFRGTPEVCSQEYTDELTDRSACAKRLCPEGGVGQAMAALCHCKDPETERLETFHGSSEGILLVGIVRGRGMRDTGWFPGGIDQRFFYCTVRMPDCKGDLFATRQVKETLQPVWREETRITQYSPGSPLEFAVWETDEDGNSEMLGKANLRAAKFDENGFNGELELELGTDPLKAFLMVKVRRPGQHCPGRMEEFRVNIENAERRALGVDFDCQDGTTLYITGIRPGLIRSYNSRVEPNWRVDLGDFIMKVNGVEGECFRLVERVRKDPLLELVVRRPMELVVALGTCPTYDGLDLAPTPRKGERRRCGPTCSQPRSAGPKKPLGLHLKEPSGNSLVITRVLEGLADEWNQSNPEQAVRGGDRIIAFNGKRGRAHELLRNINSAENFHMTIVRPSDLEGSVRDARVPPLPLHRLDAPF